MASSDASGRAYDVFVQRFLTGLSGALHLNNGERATGVKRRIGALRDDTTGMSTSRKVLDARMALGADDALYLQSGLGLLWAGDENLDEKHALFPSSLGSASVGDVARNAAASQLARNVDERVLSIIKELTERLPGLVYLLSLPEIADHIKADLTQRRLVGVSASKGVNDASRYRKDSNLWSGNAPTTLARLITTLAAVKASGRHLANMGDEVDGWINRIREDKSREHVEELITVCASLYGLYMRSAENVPGLVSPMEYTTLYTSAAVDAALTRDWSTIDGVLRAYRADRATQPEGTVAVRDGDSVVGGKGARPLTRGGAGGGGEDSPFAVPGLGPSRAPASTGAAVVDEASVLGSVAGSVSTTGNDAVVVSTLREAGDNNNSANRGNWMSRMLSRNQSAEIGAHTDDAGNSAHSDKTTDPEEHSLKQHRVELTDTQQEGTLAPDLARMKNLVLNPVTAMAALSMELTASPLWQSGVRGDDFDTMTNTRRDNVSLHAKYVAPLIDRRLDPKGAEITFEQDALTRTVTRRRVTGNTVVLSLYDGALGSPYRSMPAEVRAWVQDANNATAPVGNFLRTTQRDKPDDERVDGTTADREALRSARDGEWGDVVEANDRGVAASEELMRPFTDFAHKDRRFVAYAMQRGLVCAPGPHQIPQTYSAQEGMVKVDNVLENEQQTLRYTRGICHAAVRMQKEPNKSNNVGGGGGANLRAVVPTLMHSYWTEVRDGFKSENGTFSVVTEANRLRLMASMQSQLDLGLNERDSAERRRSPQAELLTYWHKTLSARSTVAGIAGAPPRLPKTFGGKSQELSDTQCDVLWAPIVAERTQGPPYNPPETEYLRTETSYTTGAVAACAAATYEHLLDAANHRILVVDGIRTAVKACLKLKQLPHMIAFDAQWTKAAEDGNGRVGNTRMQYIMTDEKMTGRASRMVPIYSATGINGTPLFRTILPSYRRTGDNILEPVASAFSGVWQHRPNMLPGGNNRRWNDLQGGGVYGALSNFGAANLLGSRSPTLFEAFGQLAATAQDIAAPQWGLSVPHVPVGLTHVRTLDAQEEEAALTATGEEKRNRRVKYDDSVSPDYLVAPYERQPVEPYRAHPPWLDSDYKIQKLIRECFELSSQLRELMLQSDAFKAALTDDARAAATGTTSLVERERRGAVWEDALREMAISSDRMYNFLRTMAGTLHEDVQSVVEVEACLTQRTALPTPTNVTSRRVCLCCVRVHRTTPWRRPIGRCASGDRRSFASRRSSSRDSSSA